MTPPLGPRDRWLTVLLVLCLLVALIGMAAELWLWTAAAHWLGTH